MSKIHATKFLTKANTRKWKALKISLYFIAPFRQRLSKKPCLGEKRGKYTRTPFLKIGNFLENRNFRDHLTNVRRTGDHLPLTNKKLVEDQKKSISAARLSSGKSGDDGFRKRKKSLPHMRGER